MHHLRRPVLQWEALGDSPLSLSSTLTVLAPCRPPRGRRPVLIFTASPLAWSKDREPPRIAVLLSVAATVPLHPGSCSVVDAASLSLSALGRRAQTPRRSRPQRHVLHGRKLGQRDGEYDGLPPPARTHTTWAPRRRASRATAIQRLPLVDGRLNLGGSSPAGKRSSHSQRGGRRRWCGAGRE